MMKRRVGIQRDGDLCDGSGMYRGAAERVRKGAHIRREQHSFKNRFLLQHSSA